MNLFELNKRRISQNLQESYSQEIEKGAKANIGETREWDGKKMQKQANGEWVEVKETVDSIKDFSPTNKSIKQLKQAVDQETDYVSSLRKISVYTLDTLKEFKAKFIKMKSADSFKNLSKETKDEFSKLQKYNEYKIADLKDRLKRQKEQDDQVKKYGGSSSYIDNRRK